MKKGTCIALCLVLTILMCPFCFAYTNVTDERSSISVSIPDSAIVVTPENVSNNQEILYKIGKTEEDMKALFDSGYVFYAFTNDEKHIISLCSYKNNISEAAIDLFGLKAEEREKIIDLLCGESAKNAESKDEVEYKGAYWYKYAIRDSETQRPSIYYVTIMNGYCVSLCLDCTVSELTENAESMISTIFENMTYTVQTQYVGAELSTTKTMKIILWVAIAVFIGLAVWGIISGYNEIKRRNDEDEWNCKHRRKPRR